MTKIVGSFVVHVSRSDKDWLIEVSYADGSEYAKVFCGDLDIALKMAVPYMACLSQPDTFADLLGLDDL